MWLGGCNLGLEAVGRVPPREETFHTVLESSYLVANDQLER
jgi:hypothetical protein